MFKLERSVQKDSGRATVFRQETATASPEAATSSNSMMGSYLNYQVSSPNDSAEVGAEQMADQVMSGQPIMRDSESGSSGGGIAQSAGSLSSGGDSMDAGVRSSMENSFGADFSDVRIHHDDQAASMSEELSANAFTTGSDIYFNEGQYSPDSGEGAHLLAHELAHVVQGQEGIFREKKKSKNDPTAQTVPQAAQPQSAKAKGAQPAKDQGTPTQTAPTAPTQKEKLTTLSKDIEEVSSEKGKWVTECKNLIDGTQLTAQPSTALFENFAKGYDALKKEKTALEGKAAEKNTEIEALVKSVPEALKSNALEIKGKIPQITKELTDSFSQLESKKSDVDQHKGNFVDVPEEWKSLTSDEKFIQFLDAIPILQSIVLEDGAGVADVYKPENKEEEQFGDDEGAAVVNSVMDHREQVNKNKEREGKMKDLGVTDSDKSNQASSLGALGGAITAIGGATESLGGAVSDAHGNMEEADQEKYKAVGVVGNSLEAAAGGLNTVGNVFSAIGNAQDNSKQDMKNSKSAAQIKSTADKLMGKLAAVGGDPSWKVQLVEIVTPLQEATCTDKSKRESIKQLNIYLKGNDKNIAEDVKPLAKALLMVLSTNQTGVLNKKDILGVSMSAIGSALNTAGSLAGLFGQGAIGGFLKIGGMLTNMIGGGIAAYTNRKNAGEKRKLTEQQGEMEPKEVQIMEIIRGLDAGAKNCFWKNQDMCNKDGLKDGMEIVSSYQLMEASGLDVVNLLYAVREDKKEQEDPKKSKASNAERMNRITRAIAE